MHCQSSISQFTFRNGCSWNGECPCACRSLSIHTNCINTVDQVSNCVWELITLNSSDLSHWHKAATRTVISFHINGVIDSWWAETRNIHLDCTCVRKKCLVDGSWKKTTLWQDNVWVTEQDRKVLSAIKNRKISEEGRTWFFIPSKCHWQISGKMAVKTNFID